MFGFMQTVVETPAYISAAKQAGVDDDLRTRIVDLVASDPLAGVELKGTGGCRKVRIAGRGKGKSGGFRIVHFYSGTDIPVFLLTVFGKGEKDNISDAEAAALAGLTKRLIDAHRPKIVSMETRR